MVRSRQNLGYNKGYDNLIPAKKGEVRNPKGRPKGHRDYATIYREALIMLAKKNGTTAERLEVEMIANAAVLGRKGDFRFYKDILDRLYGMPTQKQDITTNGKDLLFTKEKTDDELAEIAGL